MLEFTGLKQHSKNKTGFTMVEVLISVLLLTVIFLAVSALQVGGYRFFLTAKDKAEVGYELQYAIEHIYEHVFVGIVGISDDPTVSPIDYSDLEFTIDYIDKIDKKIKKGYYRITEAGVFEFDKDYDGVTFDVDESLGSKVDFIPSECAFTMDGNLFRIKLTAEFPLARAGVKQLLTLYSASYPRCASFN